MRQIILMYHTVVEGDAVGNDILMQYAVLERRGYDVRIFCESFVEEAPSDKSSEGKAPARLSGPLGYVFSSARLKKLFRNPGFYMGRLSYYIKKAAGYTAPEPAPEEFPYAPAPRIAYKKIGEKELGTVLSDPENTVVYHHAGYWENGEKLLAEARCRVYLRYHNITPPDFFGGYGDTFAEFTHKGMRQTESFVRSGKISRYIATSGYSSEDLIRLGVEKSRIDLLGPFHLVSDFDRAKPNADLLRELIDGIPNVLFVGRIAPNKGLHHIVEVMREYTVGYGRKIRLNIVGGLDPSLEKYYDDVLEKIRQYGLSDIVVFRQRVSFTDLRTYYLASHAFLLTSEHEGFCVPILEAQHHRLPIVALDRAAVGETLGKGGILIKDPDYGKFASSLHSVIHDNVLRFSLAEEGGKNFMSYESERMADKFCEILFDEAFYGKRVSEPRPSGDAPRVCLVTSWFGGDLKGGAEQQAMQIAKRLALKGADVEVYATCSKEFLDDWSRNHYDFGATLESGVDLVRFPVRKRNTASFDRLNGRLLSISPDSLRPGESPISRSEERIYVEENINSPEMFRHIAKNRDRFDAFLFMPYLFPAALKGIPAAGEKAILQPCLHDECYAYLEVTTKSFRLAERIFFNSSGEMQTARKIYGDRILQKSVVIGEGVEPAAPAAEAAGPEGKFILYLGRRDEGKNTDKLIRNYEAFLKKTGSKMRLVLAGPAVLPVRPGTDMIVDLGLVDEKTKSVLLANCRALINPSTNESFSRVIFEAWFAKKPVVVHAECPATFGALQESGGAGWSVGDDEASFVDVLSKIEGATAEELSAIGGLGFAYAKSTADWDSVIERYMSEFQAAADRRKAACRDTGKAFGR